MKHIPGHGVGRLVVLAAREIEAFSRRLGGQVALPALTAALTALVGRRVTPSSVVLLIGGDP
jgi:anti-sigma factor RsiW